MTGRVESIELTRYVAPGRALARPHGLVVRVRAGRPGGQVTGVGEAVVAGDRTGPAWRELRAVAARLVGAALPPRVAANDPLPGLAGWRPVRAVDRGARRAAKLAVEMALLDLLRAAADPAPAAHPLADPAPGVHPLADPQPEHRLPLAPPDSPQDRLTGDLQADPGSSWAVRLRLTGRSDLDLAWFRRAVAVDRAGGRHRPIWLVGGERDRAGAGRFIRELAQLLVEAEPAARVLVEEPVAAGRQSLAGKAWQRSGLARWRRSPLAGLQRIADAALGPAAGPRRLTIVAGQSVVSAGQVRALAGSVGGLHLRLDQFGTLAGLRAAAREAKRRDPGLIVLLGGGRGSRITAVALAALAAATPEIDRYLPAPPPAGWPELLPAGGPAGRPAAGEVDLAELAAVADDVEFLPPVPATGGAAEPPNRFPDYPLGGTALAVRSMLLETEALRRGLPTRRLARDLFLIEHPESGEAVGFVDSESGATSAAASVAMADKGVTRALLERAGLPVPPGRSFPATDRDGAYRAGIALGFPLVVKPAGGSKGTAVTTGIGTAGELARALDEVLASKYAATGIVVERFATGHDYRVLATRDEVLSVVRREPASVVGDGRRTVEELVLAANVLRRHNPHLAKRPIRLDQRVADQLRRQGLDRRVVPAAGRRVQLRAEANLSLGGDSREVLDAVHPSLSELAVAVVRAVPGLPYAGLDLLLADHRRPVQEQPVTIIEVNSRPVQSLHHFPMFGPPRNVSARLVELAAQAAGWRLGAPADQVTVRVSVAGRVRGVGYRSWLATMATQLGLAGSVGPAGPAGPDGVAVLARGPAARVGLLLRLAFHGPAGAVVTETRAEPVDLPVRSGFAVRTRARA